MNDSTMKLFRNLSLLLLSLVSFNVFCQSVNLKFQHIGRREGLSQSTVVSIFQDKKGFMWFGTTEGLNKYDGYTIKIYKYDPNYKYSLSNNYVNNIKDDSYGTVWISTLGGGLSGFDISTERFVSYKHDKNNPHSISGDLITTTFEDSKGNFWVGTQGQGLNLFDRKSKKFTHYKYDENNSKTISNNTIKDIIEDSDGNLWVGTAEGGLNLFNYSENSFTRLQHDPLDNESLGHNAITSMLEDSKGNFWISTYGGGFDLLDRKTRKFKHFRHDINNPNSLSNDFLLTMAEDHDGNLYLGTENWGLSIYNPGSGSFRNYMSNVADVESLATNSINSLYRDTRGNMWIGTFNGGINLLTRDGNKFTHYKHIPNTNSLSNNKVLSIFEDSKENLWIGTDGGGLNLLNRKTGKFSYFLNNIKSDKSICGNNVLSIAEDNDNNIWIGTWAEGITVFNPEKHTYRHYKNNPNDSGSLGGNNIWKIFKDSKGNIWIGTFGRGVDLYDKKNDRFIHFIHDKNDPYSLSDHDNIINFIFEDSKENLWISTNSSGINLLDRKTGRFTHYRHDETKNSVRSNTINCTYEDKNGDLWISTNAGLSFLDRSTNKFTVYGPEDGLPSEVLWGILPDDHGNLWISTNKGVSKFNPDTKVFKNYDVADGLQDEEFKQSFWRSKSGKLYFGGINGFNEFFPDSVKETPFDPPLFFTDFLIFNESVRIADPNESNSSLLKKHISETKEITLSYNHSVFSLEFASLHYTIPERKKYQYILEGFDKNWNNVGTKHTATYTNLDPGKYMFKVRGLNNNGTWSKSTLELKVNIKPPYWKTWWFRILFFLFVIGCLFAIYFIRIKVINNQKSALEALVNQRTSEVVAQKEEILHQQEKLEHLYFEMKDSIRAAEVIQQSILPSETKIKQYLPASFILYLPKDVVSGDFYWFDVKENKIIIAVVDCTGHGVSGAFMSINGHHLLNQAIYLHDNLTAAEILNRLNEGLYEDLNRQQQGLFKDLKSEETFTADGMDISLCIIDKKKNTLQYAGANSPLYLLRNKEIIQFKANKYSISSTTWKRGKTYDNQEIELQKGDSIYMFSDGYADQLGGPSNEKFMYPRFRELLLEIADKDMNDQVKCLQDNLNQWKNDLEQLDDILILGFRV